MCLNCGCDIPDDTMGNDDNITVTTLAKAAIASDMNGQGTLAFLKRDMELVTPEMLDKKIAELKKK